ncbi:ATP-binding protein (plasmid) [Streptomyces sp. AHU1]|uniref:ATP-binding protein n=1 Tax=Streptomyces sp. AHU1 TaxID=3377215 RepID=UPI0038780C04
MHRVDSSHFLGRDRELSEIRRCWEGLAERSCHVHLWGPPGIGKTALLQVCTREAADRDMQVLQAAGSRAEQGLPFATLHQLLRPLLPGMKHLPPTQQNALLAAFGMIDASPVSEPTSIGLAALELLADGAASQPLLAIVDDVQWADPYSAQVIDFVSRRLTTERAMLLVATREPPAPMPSMAESQRIGVCLQPLDGHDARRLLTLQAPHVAPGTREKILVLAQGNPLAVTELPRSMAPLEPVGNVHLTDRLHQTFACKLEECTPDAKSLLLVAALLDSDRSAEAEQAASLLLGRVIGPDDWQAAQQSELVSCDGETVMFQHPLMRSAVVRSATPEAVSDVHQALAQTLCGNPDRAIWHRASALQRPDASVADELESSANRALRRGAPILALSLLERAAQLSPAPASSGHRLLRAAEISFELGRPQTVRRLLDQVQAHPLLPEDAGRLIALETAFDDGVSGGERLVQRLRKSASESIEAGDSEIGVKLLIRAVRACYWGASRNEYLLEQLRTATASLKLPPDDSRPAVLDAFLNPFSKGPQIVRHLEKWSNQERVNPVQTGLLAMASFVSGCFERTVPLTDLAEGGLREQGRRADLAQLLVLRAFACLYLGRWELSAAAADKALRLAKETEQTTWAACAQLGLASVAAIRGRQRQAMRLVNEVQKAVVLSGNVSVANGIQLTRGLAALGQENPGAAFEEFDRMIDPESPTYQSPQCVWVLDYFAESAYAAGRQDEALERIRQVEQHVRETPASGMQRAVALARAVLVLSDDAEKHFESARRHYGKGAVWYDARLDLAEGSWLRRRRRNIDSRKLLIAAQHAFDAMDVPAWSSRARRELAATGHAGSNETYTRRTTLSPQELEIARLAAQGLSNREIGERLYLSHRTVGSHLYRLFPKLGIQARTQLASALMEIG